MQDSPELQRRWLTAGLAATVVYATLAAAVRSDGWVTAVDTEVLRWSPVTRWPALEPVASVVVLLGQRAIALALAVSWLVLRAVRTRDVRPLLVLAVATLVLNATVGAAKFGLDRLGPLQLGPDALAPGGSTVFTDGTVFPSGHAANAVVTWGVLVLVARHRQRLGAWLAASLAVLVGAATVYLGTHWVSDVVAGWAAGVLVLLVVPALAPVVDRAQRAVRRVASPGAPGDAGPAGRGPVGAARMRP